jgi:hypothetical protein
MATLKLSRPLPARYRDTTVARAHAWARMNRHREMVDRVWRLPVGPGPWVMGRWAWLNLGVPHG